MTRKRAEHQARAAIACLSSSDRGRDVMFLLRNFLANDRVIGLDLFNQKAISDLIQVYQNGYKHTVLGMLDIKEEPV